MAHRWRLAASRWWTFAALAAAARVAYWALVTPRWEPDSDAGQYVELSRSLANGDGFSAVFPQMTLHPTAFRPPLYPVLLTPGAWLFGDALWPGRLVNVVLGCAVVVLAGSLAARIAGRAAGQATAVAVALYPPLLANDTITLTEPLALVLLLGAVLLMDDDRWLAAAIATGLLLLTRPNGYLVVAILAAWCWQRLDLRRAAMFAGVAALVVLPWLVRNQVQVGTWRPTTSDGFTLAAIYAKPAQEAEAFVDPAFSDEYGDAEHRLAQFDEAAWSRLLTEDGIDGLRDDPGYVFDVMGRNAEAFFEISPSESGNAQSIDGRNYDFNNTTRPIFRLVSVVGLAGLALHRRDTRIRLLAVIVTQFVILSLVLVAPPRLRAPFDIACCIGLGLVVAWIGQHRPRQRLIGPG